MIAYKTSPARKTWQNAPWAEYHVERRRRWIQATRAVCPPALLNGAAVWRIDGRVYASTRVEQAGAVVRVYVVEVSA